MEKVFKQKKGITLIALVITIIVLLILAGISISMLSGDNSILQKTTDAKTETEKASGKEQIDIAIVGSYSRNGSIDLELLTDNLNKIEGLTDKSGNIISEENPVISLPITVKINNKYIYKISSDGYVSEKKDVVLAQGLTIGSTVTYEPIGSTYLWEAQYASSDLATDGTADVTLDSRADGSYRITKWKVFKIDEDEEKIQIVPSSTKGTVRLQGAQGYNNAVQLLNAACSTLYSYSSKEITARSIDMDDIEPLFDETKLQTAKDSWNHNSKSYLNEKDQTSSAYVQSNSYFPKIYEEENKSVINGVEKSEGLELSREGSKLYKRNENTILTNQTTDVAATNGYFQATTSIQPYQTYYYFRDAFNSSSNFKEYGGAYVSMLKSSPSGRYWIATRNVSCTDWRWFILRLWSALCR